MKTPIYINHLKCFRKTHAAENMNEMLKFFWNWLKKKTKKNVTHLGWKLKWKINILRKILSKQNK